QHARLFLREGSWFLEDLGSRNTTFLNDRPVAQPVPLRVGDVIRLAGGRIALGGPGGGSAAPPVGDGLTGRADEGLPDGTLFRSATLLFTAPAVAGEDPGGLAGRPRFLNDGARPLRAPPRRCRWSRCSSWSWSAPSGSCGPRKAPSSCAMPRERSPARLCGGPRGGPASRAPP